MAQTNYNVEAGEDGEDTDDLLCTDAAHSRGLASLALPRDHCDMLLDAIDAELSRLQAQNQNLRHDENCKGEGVKRLAYLCRSPSLCKDTGLGCTGLANDGEHQDTPSHEPECKRSTSSPPKPSGGRQDSAGPSEREGSSETSTPEEEQRGLDARTEQCRWRLERLLGRTDRGAPEIGTSTPPDPDSICTEDFTQRFREETVDLEEKSRTESTQSMPHDTAALNKLPSFTGARDPATENGSIGINVRYLAGVPVRSFDAVTIDSDLDSVRTEQVHRHLHKSFDHRKVIKAVEQMNSMFSDHSDCDTLAEEEGSQQYRALASTATIGSCGRQRIEKSPQSRGQLFSSDENSEESESVQHSRCDHKDGRHRSSAHRRSRGNRVKQNRGNSLSCGWILEQMTERRLLEETLSHLRKDSEREENKLLMKRAQLCETEQSLADLLQQQQCVLQQLELLRLEVEQKERDSQRLQANLRDNTAQSDTSRCELRRLQTQRDSCLLEVRGLQEELDTLERSQIVHWEGGEARLAGGVSVLEREEMDRLLENAKSDLFSEQRRFRHTLDSMSEKLDEAQQELDQRAEELRTLRRRCTELEVQLTNTSRLREEQEECLQRQLKDQEGTVGALERIVAQKEVLLLGLQQERSALQMELNTQKEEHHKQCSDIQEQGQRKKEEALEAHRLQLSLDHEKNLQQVRLQAQELKSEALREQAQSHTQHMEFLESCIKLKEEEVRRLTGALETQEEAMRRHEEQLRGETEEKVQKALDQEQRRWEEQREAALQEQRRRMEREAQGAQADVQAEVEKEKRNALGLQSKMLELQAKVQTMENELCLQQREQSSAQAAMVQALREEHQAELLRQRKQAEQEAQMDSLRLRQILQQSEAQLQSLQATLAVQERDHQMAQERHEQQQRRWAQELQMECQTLQSMLGNGGHGNTLLSCTCQAVETLQALRLQFQTFISGLQQELELQKHTNQKLGQDKEHELRLEREQMLMEKERALQTLRERLIQEHIEELSILNRPQLRGALEGGVVDSLRRQLRDKDEELRQVQRSMSQWKEKTAARLARRFEEELTAELDKCKADLLKRRRTPRLRSDQEKKLQRLEEEMRQLTMGGDFDNMPSATLSSPVPQNPPSALRSQDLASYKLLRHLQSRIRQLHSESRTHQHSPPHLAVGPPELTGSYLETIPDTQESSWPFKTAK
ncbi:trichohyalin isoform X1 [Alosa sapidissima]|uniref:trichohyalin isoform X1 n=1 Tax=Alosa sapidissima TaxID=34773 RepID=UPI001C09D53A|nr:trichohyalin isoform X1 [Alosa sapidissima]